MAKINRAAFTRGRGPVFGQEAIYADPRVQMAQRMVLDKPNRPIHTVGGGLAQMGEQWTNALALTLAENRARQEQEERAEKLAKSLVGPMPTPAGQGPRAGNVDAQKAYAERLRQTQEGLMSGAIPSGIAQEAIARRMYPEWFQADPKTFKVGNNLVRVQGDTATPIYSAPEALETEWKEIKRGDKIVTLRRGPDTNGRWVQDSVAPRFSDRPVVEIKQGQEKPTWPLEKPKPGFTWARDPKTFEPLLRKDPRSGLMLPYQVPIPGGPAAIEEEEKSKAKLSEIKRKYLESGIMLDEIDKALAKTEEWGATGVPFELTSQISDRTPAGQLKNTLETLQALIGFERLQQMRSESPTGGALGQVSNRENTLLQAVKGKLNPAMGKEMLTANLNRLRRHVFNAVYGTKQELDDAVAEGKIDKKTASYVNAQRPQADLKQLKRMWKQGIIGDNEFRLELESLGITP